MKKLLLVLLLVLLVCSCSDDDENVADIIAKNEKYTHYAYTIADADGVLLISDISDVKLVTFYVNSHEIIYLAWIDNLTGELKWWIIRQN